jgi:hypothetical protein
VLAVLAGLAVALTSSVWVSGHPTSSVLCSCGDPGQTVWFVEWVPWAITHGHNPFLTQAMFAGQGGANLLQSTSYLLQSFVLGPVTLLFGPTAAFNAAETIGPVISGWCMFVAARRVSGSWVGQAGAAVLWGFFPFVVGAEEFGHLNFSFLFFPPLLFVCLYDLCAAERRSPQWIGAWLGVLVAAQFLAGTELLALTAVAAVVGLAAALASNWRQAWERRRRIGVGLAVAAGVTLVLVAYPAWMLFEGPRHIVGPPWPGIGALSSSLGSIGQPGLVHSTSPFSRIGGYYGPVGPATSYLGWPLLVFLAASVAVWWRRRLAWVLVVVGAGAWLCSLGPLLVPLSSHSSQWWLPWRYLQHWPLIESIGPNRFAVIVAAAAALLFALSVDGWFRVVGGVRVLPQVESRAWRRAVAAVVLELALAGGIAISAIPLVRANVWPLTTHTVAAPAWFQTTARHLRPGAVLLVYPYPSSGTSDAVYWQAEDDLRFSIVGGRAEIPGADGRHSEHLKPLGGTDALLVDASFGFTIPPAPTAGQLSGLRASLTAWRVRVVVVVAFGRAPAWAAAVFTAAIGRLPVSQHGAVAWYSSSGVWTGGAPVTASPAAIERCSGDGYSEASIEAAPACVLRAGRR